jgi:hypothetical protein
VTSPDFGKARAKGYSPNPFFTVETSVQGNRRTAAWSHNAQQMERAMKRILETFGETVRVLLKVEAPKEASETRDPWIRHFGKVLKIDCWNAIEDHRELVFRDSATQLCIKDGEYFEYLVLDEYSVLYVYSNHLVVQKLLEEEGFEERNERLISSLSTEVYTIADAEAARRSFTQRLKLMPLEGNSGHFQ